MTRTADLPDYRRFARLARRHNLVPVVREVLGDLETPLSAFRKLQEGGGSFLLESVEGGETWGRYSILGSGAAGRFTARGRQVEIEWNNRSRARKVDDPLDALSRWLRGFDAAAIEGLPRFFGGAVGYISYDAVRYMERVPDRHGDSEAIPEIDLLLVTDLIVFDNLSHSLKLVACAQIDGDPRRAYDDAVARIDSMVERLRADAPPPSSPKSPRRSAIRSGTPARRFRSGVERAREYIESGDCFQIVLSHELRCRLRTDALHVYRALRRINPSPYMFYLDLGEREVVGASPEVLVRVDGSKVEVRPIAGTRRRGATPGQDEERTADLLADEKERAEHVMLVDLGRNDLGRVCRYGSVTTDEFMTIEKYSHVIHLVSHVTGELEPGKDCFDALRACFPAGTVSGAPKIRAMQIIDELEDRRRGVYAGAVGYFAFGGAMDTCIAIRTVVCEGGWARLGVGAGIVLDSRPARELDETLEKADALRSAIEMAEGGLDL